MTDAFKEYIDGAAPESIQFRSDGEPASAAYELTGTPFRIFSEASELPAWWSPIRDAYLRRTLHNNTLLTGVVYSEVMRVKNMPYQLVDESDDESGDIEAWQEILNTADFGKGFRSLLGKATLDLLTQDNGCFIELIGDGEVKQVSKTFSNGAKITFIAKAERTGKVDGIAYLDAATCWRTFDPEYPVVYTNPYTGQYTILHWTRVIALSQFEQGYELGKGLGLCALSRAYDGARLVSAMNKFYYEKITGQSPELFFTNTPTKQLQDSITLNQIQNLDKGFMTFKDHVIISPKSGGAGMAEFKIDKLGLHDVPDGFDYEKLLTLTVYIIADAFGIDAREIWPATASGATKGDAEVQHFKSGGKGRADLIQMIEDAINWRIFPPGITFKFDVIDGLEDKQQAEIKEIRARTRQAQITSGELSIWEARQMAAENGDIDPSFLEQQIVADDSTDAEGVDQANNPIEVEQPEDVQTPEDSEKSYPEGATLKKNSTLAPEGNSITT